MSKVKKVLGAVFASVGPLIVFVAAEHLLSLRWAIGISTAYTAGEIIWRKAHKQKLDQIFIFTAAMTLGFGAIDLVLNQPVFLKYEAVGTNVLTGIYFGATAFAEKSLIQEAYEKAPGAKPVDADLAAYFRAFTAVWAGYFFVKAVGYFFIARAYDYDHALAIRTVVGNVSMFALVGLSWLCGERLFSLAKRLGLVRISAPSPAEAPPPTPAP